MGKHIFIVAGDASGDVYGAQLVENLKSLDPTLTIAGLGGDMMASTDMTFLYNLVREFSVMGVIPVILGMPKVMRFLEIILDYFDQNRPDMLILIDYPGFNLYLATFAKRRHIPTVYYVTPQIWAWAPWRIKKIKRLISKMLVIFPFEVAFYEKANIPVEYVGHPLLDKIALFGPDTSFITRHNIENPNPILGLLPGSRHSEIKRNLPVMLWAASKLMDKEKIQCILALSSLKYSSLVNQIYEEYRSKMALPPLTVVFGETYQVIHHSRLVLVTSGTATLETALLEKPMIVLYRIPRIHKWLVDHTNFMKTAYFSLPNIISGKSIVPEFAPWELCPSYILESLFGLWKNSETHQKCIHDLQEMKQKMGETGASARTAKAVIKLLHDTK